MRKKDKERMRMEKGKAQWEGKNKDLTTKRQFKKARISGMG
jgi:hypothetical protein